MLKFNEFLQTFLSKDYDVSFDEIENLYDKAHIAIQIVRMYNPNFLLNISTIANLSTGAYGLYNSGENKKILPPDVEQRLIYYGKLNKNNIGNIPSVTLKKYFPEIDERKIKKGDTIRINVKRILSQSKTNLEAVLHIASTIIHESTHEIERETKGKTFETGPEGEEKKFMQWAQMNMDKILHSFPELNQ